MPSANNLLPAAIAGGGLAYNLSQGQKPTAIQSQLQGQANQAGATGSQLSGYLTSGTLPPGLQTGVDNALAADKAHAVVLDASNRFAFVPHTVWLMFGLGRGRASLRLWFS